MNDDFEVLQYKADLGIRLRERESKREDLKKINQTEVLEIDNNSLYILLCFKKEWTNGGDEKAEQFFIWFEENYITHLIAHTKNKSQHFFHMRKLIQRKSFKDEGEKLFNILFKCGIPVIGSVTGTKIIGEIIKIQSKITRWKVGALEIIVCLVLSVLLYHCWNEITSAILKESIGFEKKKETWLRHQEAISNYQKEMLDYLWNTGVYNHCIDEAEKNQLVQERIMLVWKKNQDRFQGNMSKDNQNL